MTPIWRPLHRTEVRLSGATYYTAGHVHCLGVNGLIAPMKVKGHCLNWLKSDPDGETATPTIERVLYPKPFRTPIYFSDTFQMLRNLVRIVSRLVTN